MFGSSLHCVALPRKSSFNVMRVIIAHLLLLLRVYYHKQSLMVHTTTT